MRTDRIEGLCLRIFAGGEASGAFKMRRASSFVKPFSLLLLLLDAYGDALDHVLPKLFLLDGYCKVAFTDAS